MALVSPKLLVAFDAGSIAAATIASHLRGPRIKALSRVPLAPGALTPSPLEANLLRPAEVREALRAVARALQADGRRACLVLPDGVARTILFDVPPGTDPVDFARFRLAPSLPYPATEAVVDVLSVGRGRYVGAAVRRAVVASYEAAAAEAGLEQERVDLAPLAALGWLRRGVGRAPTLDVILGDAALSLAAFDEGELRAFRGRRRDPTPDEAERLRAELDRTLALTGGNGATPRVRVVGSGAPALIRALSFGGRPAEPGWELPADGRPVGAVELAWLGAAFA